MSTDSCNSVSLRISRLQYPMLSIFPQFFPKHLFKTILYKSLHFVSLVHQISCLIYTYFQIIHTYVTDLLFFIVQRLRRKYWFPHILTISFPSSGQAVSPHRYIHFNPLLKVCIFRLFQLTPKSH